MKNKEGRCNVCQKLGFYCKDSFSHKGWRFMFQLSAKELQAKIIPAIITLCVAYNGFVRLSPSNLTNIWREGKKPKDIFPQINDLL